MLGSCTSELKNSATYFGGKIINPKSKFVVLYSMDKPLDTIFLDKQNKFLAKIDDAKEGLYYFVHGVEHQYIYLEPQDSLLMRLNTWDFDESLVFAGKGAERNNILIDCFLEGEKDNRKYYKFNKLEPASFKHKTDSVIALKLKTYNDYIKNHPEETDGFKDLLKVAITYPIYARTERYPMAYTKYSKQKEFPITNADFYNYRKNIDIHKNSFMYFSPYSHYIKTYLYNTTFAQGQYLPMTNEYSTDFTVDLLKTIDTQLQSGASKDAFLKQTVIGHFYEKSSCNINEKAFDTFFTLSNNQEDKNQVKLLLNDSKYLVKGDKITNFNVTDYTNSTQDIQHLLHRKNTFLFFWNPNYFSKAYLASRINYLTKNYPNVQFLLVKIDGNNTDKIHRLDIKKQFYLDEKSNANNFLTSKMPRTILIDKQGKIVNGFASISSNNIHDQLKKLSE